jgi:hypothetical protein
MGPLDGSLLGLGAGALGDGALGGRALGGGVLGAGALGAGALGDGVLGGQGLGAGALGDGALGGRAEVDGRGDELALPSTPLVMTTRAATTATATDAMTPIERGERYLFMAMSPCSGAPGISRGLHGETDSPAAG